MENENTQPNQTPNGSNGNGIVSTITNFVKSNTKLVLIAVAVIVVLILLIAIISNATSGPKQAVKNYISAMNKLNSDKIVSSMDIKATLAYTVCYGRSTDFSESEFKKEYKKIKNSDAEDLKESTKETLDDAIKLLKDKKFSVKLIDIKNVEKLENCKNLYTVEAKVRVNYNDEDGDKQDITNTINLIVYKNKVVTADLNALLD